MTTRTKILIVLGVFAIGAVLGVWGMKRLQERRAFLGKLRNLHCVRVTGLSLDPRDPIKLAVDGTCCDTNRIRSMIRLLDDEVRATAIKHWPHGQRKKAASSLYLEIFNANGETNEMLFTLVGPGLLDVGPTSYIDAKTNLHEAILSLLEIATHEVQERKASWAVSSPARAGSKSGSLEKDRDLK
jgi:hypothetical protein